MKLFIIKFNDVDWEEDYEILVSAGSEEEAIEIGGVTLTNEGNNNKYINNIEKITEIGTYNIEKKEIVMANNKGA